MKQDDSKIGTSKMKGKVTPFTGWLKTFPNIYSVIFLFTLRKNTLNCYNWKCIVD